MATKGKRAAPPEPEAPAPECCARCGFQSDPAELTECVSCQLKCCPECIGRKLCGVCEQMRDMAGPP
jgi:hypothetical protein